METKIYTKDLCVFFLSTYHEYKTNQINRALKFYFENCDTKYSFDVYIMLDKLPEKQDELLSLYFDDFKKKYENINRIYVFSNEIPDEENFYKKNFSEKIDIKKFPMGLSHGINLHFYESLEYLLNLKDEQNLDEKKYKNFLLLETDTKCTKSDWFDVSLECCNTEKKFSILGSKYKGVDREQTLNTYFGGHLNGVAIYRNAPLTTHILNESKLFLINSLMKNKKYNNFMNYDVAIYLYLKAINKVNECLYDTNFIVNISDHRNKNISVEDVIKEFPETRIIHRKGLYDE